MKTEFNLLLNFSAAILAIINPIGLIPIWKELIGDTSPKVRRRVAAMVILTAAVVLLIFLNFGNNLLSFFQIDLAVFKVAGGVLLVFTALSMVEGKATQLEERSEKGNIPEIAKQRFKKILVPLTIPMLAGPGSITTVIIYGSQANKFMEYIELSIVLIIALLILLIILSYSHYLEKKLDDLVFSVFTRIFGVIVAAIALQFILEGLGEVFPAWLEGKSAIESQ